MPKSHKKHTRKKTQRKHAHVTAHHKKHAVAPAHHHKKRRHHHGVSHSLPEEIRRKLERPVTVKTLQDIVALRRVQRGA